MDEKWLAEIVAYTLKCPLTDVGVVKGYNLFIVAIQIGINETDYLQIVGAVEEHYMNMRKDIVPIIRFID